MSPPSIEMYPGQWADAAKRQKADSINEYAVRAAVHSAQSELNDAMLHPGIARENIERAIADLTRALGPAAILDPKETEEF